MAGNKEHGLEIQVKFSFFMVGLVFAALAASIQTAKLGTSSIGDAVELSAWLFLLISGLAGLKRIEMFPMMLHIGSLRSSESPYEDLRKEDWGKKQKIQLRFYKAHRIFLVAGFIALIFSRGIGSHFGWF